MPEIISGTLSNKSWLGSVLVAVPPDLLFTSDCADVVFIFFLLTIYESFQLAKEFNLNPIRLCVINIASFST